MSLVYFVSLIVLCLTVDAKSKLPKDYVRVPGGKLFHKTCVHHVPAGATARSDHKKNTIITFAAGKTVRHPPCPYPVINPGPLHGPAWKAWAEFNNTAPVTNLTTVWGIPPAPQSYTGQILYYWNGVEPSKNTAVLQPVLQFGETPAGGGSYWALASWYVSDVTAQYSDVVQCTSSTVVGNMGIDSSSGAWLVTGVCGSQKASLTYTPPDTDYTWAYPCVLEAYDVTDCNGQYPTSNQLVFNNIQLSVQGKQVQPEWAPQTKNNQCNEHTVVSSATQVTLFWNTQN